MKKGDPGTQLKDILSIRTGVPGGKERFIRNKRSGNGGQRILMEPTAALDESESEVTQLCPTICDPMDCSLPGFSVHGIFQTRILEWVAIFFSRRSS